MILNKGIVSYFVQMFIMMLLSIIVLPAQAEPEVVTGKVSVARVLNEVGFRKIIIDRKVIYVKSQMSVTLKQFLGENLYQLNFYSYNTDNKLYVYFDGLSLISKNHNIVTLFRNKTPIATLFL